MNIQIKHNIEVACKAILCEHFGKYGLPFSMDTLGELEVHDAIPETIQAELRSILSKYGIELIDNKRTEMVQRIKDQIIDIIYLKEKLPTVRLSDYLAEKLGNSYGYLSNLFSESTHMSIEQYLILQKVERAKQLIMANQLTLTEISYKLSYSSLAHLSNQFKNTTGITPSAFRSITFGNRYRKSR
jgi:AraC-like DNA-binding protein